MSWLTKFSLRNRSIVGLAILAVLLVGAYAITSLKQELIPDLTFPYLTVLTVDQGSAPADVERNVTTPIEQALKTSSGIKEFDSFSNDGLSIITVQYEFGTDMKAKEAEVQQAVSGVQQMLPATAMAPQVAALNFNSMPVVQLAVSSSLPPEQLATLLGTRVVPRLQAIDGVQAVTLSGVQQMQLNIQLKPEKVAALGVTPTQIMTAVTQANVTTGAGSVTSGSIVYPITVTAKAQTEKALEELVLPSTATAAAAASPGGSSPSASSSADAMAAAAASGAAPAATRPVTLGDVATVKIAPAPLTAITRTNGKASIGISVSKASSGNTVDIANAVAAELPAIARDLGGQATITTVVDQSIFIKDSIRSLLQEGIVGAIFAIIVIWVFLRSWRSTVIAGLSIPLSVIGALIILWSRGESLNMLTLGGLTIAIGRVIDDSIVVIENIYRHLQEGDSIRRAAYTGTREVAGAITASTATTVAVFLPLGLVHGLASEFFRPFAYTVTFALLCSLAVALIVVPVAATWLLSKRQVGTPGREGADQPAERVPARAQVGRRPQDRHPRGGSCDLRRHHVAEPPAQDQPVRQLRAEHHERHADHAIPVPAWTPRWPRPPRSKRSSATRKGVEIYQVHRRQHRQPLRRRRRHHRLLEPGDVRHHHRPNADKNAIIEDIRTQVAQLDNAGTITVTGDDSSSGMGGMSLMEVRVTAGDPVSAQEGERRRARQGQDRGRTRRRQLEPQRGPAVGDHRRRPGQGRRCRCDADHAQPVHDARPQRLPAGHGAHDRRDAPAQLTVGAITVPPLPGAVSQMLTRLPVAGHQRHGAARRHRQGGRGEGAGPGDPRRRRPHRQHHGDLGRQQHRGGLRRGEQGARRT